MIANLEIWRLPHLVGCTAEDASALISVDAYGVTSLFNLDLYYCENLSTINVSGCTRLQYIYAYGGALSQAAVDQLLRDLVANGVTDGYLTLAAGNNAPPSADGLAAKAILLSRGWTVSTN